MRTAVVIVAVFWAAGASFAQDGAGSDGGSDKSVKADRHPLHEDKAQERQEEELPAPGKPTKEPEAVKFDFKARTLLAYDDNIINMRNEFQKEFEAGVKPDHFRVESIDDFVALVEAEASARFALIGQAETTEAGGRAEAHLYERNGFIDYVDYRAWAAQRFGEADRLRLIGSFTPDRYNRELRDPDTGLFSSAFRDETEYRVDWRHNFSETYLEPFGGWRSEIYNSPFEFHDLRGWFVGGKLGWEPSKVVDMTLSYEYSRLDAAAGPLDPDYSNRQNEIEMSIRVRPVKALSLVGGWRIQVRDFTTTSDFEREGREDVKQRFTGSVGYEFSKRWEAVAEYRFYDVTSNRPNDNTTADETSYVRNVVMVGMTFRY